MSEHVYYFRSRPPAIGTHPDNPVNVEAWVPAQTIPWYKYRHAFGRVSYVDPLTLEEIWRYDLFPKSHVEQALLRFYTHYDRDESKMRTALGSYLDWGRERIVAWETVDRLAGPALVLLDVGWSDE